MFFCEEFLDLFGYFFRKITLLIFCFFGREEEGVCWFFCFLGEGRMGSVDFWILFVVFLIFLILGVFLRRKGVWGFLGLLIFLDC